MNRTIIDRARSMRFHAGLSKTFWAAYVDHAVYLVNKSPNENFVLNVRKKNGRYEKWTTLS